MAAGRHGAGVIAERARETERFSAWHGLLNLKAHP